MEPELTISRYKPEDKAKLLDIMMQNIPAFFAKSELDDFNDYLDNHIEQYFVVKLSGKIVGAGGINFEENHQIGIISWDLIAPEFYRRGIGTKLLNHRLGILKNMSNIRIISVRTSQLTVGFYERNGFLLKEIQKDYWAKGFDMYKMVYTKRND